MNKKAVVFDMDGVLIDSEALYQYYLVDFFYRQNQNVSKEDLYSFIGSSDDYFWSHMGEIWNPTLTPKEMKNLYEENNQHEPVDYKDLLNPHVKFVLRKLKEKGISIAIASSSPLNEIQRMVQKNEIEAYFDVLVSGDDVLHCKPSPDIYKLTLNQLNVMPRDCIVVEDSYVGICASKEAGIFTIAKREYRFSINQELADIVVDDFLSIYSEIMKHFGY